ncbi:hypothetical protein ACIA8R_34185 [Nonomuraea sp. NPDC051191]|uniref:hypothetical protein n=1 Tax=Nonomuraea sp. NPDC051191 TaxID=3364372 RepID=UPI0037B4416C
MPSPVEEAAIAAAVQIHRMRGRQFPRTSDQTTHVSHGTLHSCPRSAHSVHEPASSA